MKRKINYWQYVIIALVTMLLCIIFSDGSPAACRSQKVKQRFDVQQGYPQGRFSEGYIVDHICALEVGGLDITGNMQYQTLLESKQKDRIETTLFGQGLYCTKNNSLPTRTIFNSPPCFRK